jgi:hypothetical protein
MNRLLLLLMLMPCIAISAEEKTTWACVSVNRHIIDLASPAISLNGKQNELQRLEIKRLGIGEYESLLDGQKYTCAAFPASSEFHCANFNNTETFTFYEGLGLLSHLQNTYHAVSVKVSNCEVF